MNTTVHNIVFSKNYNFESLLIVLDALGIEIIIKDRRVGKNLKIQMKDHLMNIQNTSRKKIHLRELEEKIKCAFGSEQLYEREGGYEGFYESVLVLQDEGILVPFRKNASTNGRHPSLPLLMWLEKKVIEPMWRNVDMIRVSDKLEMEKYRKNPEFQTEAEWKRIEKLYTFLNDDEQKYWIGREERSYELFGNEKFLSSSQGRAFLNRVDVSFESIKVSIRGEPFQFIAYTTPYKTQTKKVLIIENLNLYHTLNRFYAKGYSFEGYKPDILIYGKGNHIVRSCDFFYDFFDKNENFEVSYLGDIDAAGLGIYRSLKEKKVFNNLSLHLPFFDFMRKMSKGTVSYQNHLKPESTLRLVLNEINGKDYDELAALINDLWEKDERLPQEAINYENLLKNAGEM